MTFRIKPLVVSICLLAASTVPAFADTTTATTDTDNNNVDVNQLIQKVTAQTQSLEKQVNLLKSQIKQLKQQQVQQTSKVQAQQQQVQQLQQQQQQVNESSTAQYVKGTSVVTSPLLGEHSAFDGSDLIVLASVVDLDRRLLQQLQSLDNENLGNGTPFDSSPMLELSGKVEGQVVGGRSTLGPGTSGTQLATAELDVIPVINSWTTGFIAFDYNNAGGTPQASPSNSEVYVDRAFATVGNFNKSPFYASLGLMYVPFSHQYSSYMIDSTLPTLLGITKDPALLLGYLHSGDNGFYSNLYTFKGDTQTSSSNNNINNVGAAIGYQNKNDNWSNDFGVAAIGNIADSLGMQDTGASSGFEGFGENGSTNEQLVRRVPGLDVHDNLSYGPYSLYAEYTGATSSFNQANLAFDNDGAKPQAWVAEAAYSFPIVNKPSSVALNYAHSYQALALNLPEQRISAVFNTSIWKDTIASIEFEHDINYNSNTSASGQGVAYSGPALGGTADRVIGQFGIYF